MKLWLSDEALRKEVDLEKNELYKKAIEKDAVEYYNDISKRSKNMKSIVKCKIVNCAGVSEVHIILESSESLNIPNRALKVYSSYLANGPLSNLVPNKSLFRGSSELIESETENEMTYEEILNYLLHCVLRNTKEDKSLLDEVRKIVKERGGK